MNKVMIIGNLARDPELLTSTNGISYCRFTVAVSRRFGKDEATDFLPCVAWRGLADNCAKYITKGSKVAVAGSIQTRSYDKDGEKRYVTEIQADDVEFLSSKNADAESFSSEPSKKQVGKLTPVEDNDDGLPF